MLKGGKAGQASLALSGDEDKLQAAAQLIIGAAAIYDGSVTSISGSQVCCADQCLQFAFITTRIISHSCQSCCHQQWLFDMQFLLPGIYINAVI